jgi:hypothetical protein
VVMVVLILIFIVRRAGGAGPAAIQPGGGTQTIVDTSMVGEGIAPSAANPEPCVIVSDHTAPQCMVNCD